jgi:hypothetical protein
MSVTGRRESALGRRVADFTERTARATQLYAQAKAEKDGEKAKALNNKAEQAKDKAAIAGRDIYHTALNLGRAEEYKEYAKYHAPKKVRGTEKKNPNDMRSEEELDTQDETLRDLEAYAKEGDN